ncbi:MAG: hypothetical protein C0448_02410 [Sphingobacteriaceae bacterium]|nr:hypothetical protein [Sphingobacteriaceae bacterium]
MTITDLIIDFQNTAKIVAEKFYEKYGTKELLLAVNSDKTIPRQGSLGIIKDYSFHGCGLYAELNGVEIDFDFGDNNRVDGFDAWRLKHFAESKKSIYPNFVTEKAVQIELDKLTQLGQINKPGTFPGSSNYYWAK